MLQTLARQGLLFRGNLQDSGNANELLKLCGRFDPVLAEWICKPSTTNPRKYIWTNWDTQNDVLQTLSHLVLRSIVENVRKCRFWSLSMNESQDITVKEKVVFAVRIVHPDTFEISEQFFGFVETADTLAKLAEDSLTAIGLDFQGMRGMAFGGTASMTEKNNVVRTRLGNKDPFARFW